MSENDKMSLHIHKKMKYPVNQIINNLTVLKTDKNCRKLPNEAEHASLYASFQERKMEEILRYAQNDKRLPRFARNDGFMREGWQRLPHSEARSNSVQPDPQGHARKKEL